MDPKMLLVIEGVDGSGKTTLAKQLSRHYHAVVMGFPRLEGIDSPTFVHFMSGAGILSQHGINIIMDRSLISDMIYASIRGDFPRAQRDNLFWFNHSYQPIYIYCRPHKDVIMENIEKTRQDSWVKHDFIDACLLAYDNAFGAKGFATAELNNKMRPALEYRYDESDQPLIELIERIDACLPQSPAQ